MKVRADQIKVGFLLDLEGDPYADPDHGGTPDHLNSFEFELAEVTEVEMETADCVRIGGPGFCVGFPVDHEIDAKLGRGACVCYSVSRAGYDVRVYDPDMNEVETYEAGNSRWDSQAYVEPRTPDALDLRTLKRFARQTAEEMADAWGINLPMVHLVESDADQ
jgi:hypothetical protein